MSIFTTPLIILFLFLRDIEGRANKINPILMESMDRTISAKKVTYDFHRMMDNAEKVTSSGFADEMIKRM